jgi:prepilin-type N-terminal cleavage/methylation domain-containing protein
MMNSSIARNSIYIADKQQHGFTVLEILVSLTIIGITVVSILELTSMNLRNLSKSSDQVNALLAANSKMRRILEMDKMEDKSWRETDEQGYTYEISINEIKNKRTENLPVKLEEIILTLHYIAAKKEKIVTLRAEKLFTTLQQAKINTNPLP